MVRSLVLESLTIRGFRNLTEVSLDAGPRFNVVSGANGQGKTNLLEAIYVGATTRSFRSSKPSEWIGHAAATAISRLTVSEAGERRVQIFGLETGRRFVRVDGKRPASLAEYAVRTPVVVFHPGEAALSIGGGRERRSLLDRVAFYERPASTADVQQYIRALRSRQAVLESRGSVARDLDHWEDQVVRFGLAVTKARIDACARLSDAAVQAFSSIGDPRTKFDVQFVPSAPLAQEAYRSALREKRAVDLRRGFAGVGPHRDDLLVSLDGRTCRGIASQGQHRAVVLALKLAEATVVEAVRGVRPVLLLDDVSSELDRDRTSALFSFLRQRDGQVFLSTTRPEMIETGGGEQRRDFEVSQGVVMPSAPPVSR